MSEKQNETAFSDGEAAYREDLLLFTNEILEGLRKFDYSPVGLDTETKARLIETKVLKESDFAFYLHNQPIVESEGLTELIEGFKTTIDTLFRVMLFRFENDYVLVIIRPIIN